MERIELTRMSYEQVIRDSQERKQTELDKRLAKIKIISTFRSDVTSNETFEAVRFSQANDHFEIRTDGEPVHIRGLNLRYGLVFAAGFASFHVYNNMMDGLRAITGAFVIVEAQEKASVGKDLHAPQFMFTGRQELPRGDIHFVLRALVVQRDDLCSRI